eukprot:CAMPEP_0198224814 /NCGR_PEP_ID=MMETSP1445-20131203/98408_1 /TAXON_ID=36898 /ORGANISM="Pyramimonas sp., Strain CCMP2087" /LENGTH=37 /DNA_ID= /DNA_START= /DNA_END= /DNA_ORIENTATION=
MTIESVSARTVTFTTTFSHAHHGAPAAEVVNGRVAEV